VAVAKRSERFGGKLNIKEFTKLASPDEAN
jgi:hypothetical protein